MRAELQRIEKEIDILDEELEKLHTRILQILVVRRKREHDLKAIRSNFDPPASEDYQLTLAKILKER